MNGLKEVTQSLATWLLTCAQNSSRWWSCRHMPPPSRALAGLGGTSLLCSHVHWLGFVSVGSLLVFMPVTFTFTRAGPPSVASRYDVVLEPLWFPESDLSTVSKAFTGVTNEGGIPVTSHVAANLCTE